MDYQIVLRKVGPQVLRLIPENSACLKKQKLSARFRCNKQCWYFITTFESL